VERPIGSAGVFNGPTCSSSVDGRSLGSLRKAPRIAPSDSVGSRPLRSTLTWFGEYRPDFYGAATFLALIIGWTTISNRVNEALSRIRMQEVIDREGKAGPLRPRTSTLRERVTAARWRHTRSVSGRQQPRRASPGVAGSGQAEATTMR